MITPVSLPSIGISADSYEDETTGRTTYYPTIRARANGYSLGTLTLTSVDDLFLLRKAIDNFIVTNNLNDPLMKKNDEEIPAPEFTPIIEGLLSSQGYCPISGDDVNTKGARVMTSQEIILELADMIDIDLNDVAHAMMYLGYSASTRDGKVGWLMSSVTA